MAQPSIGGGSPLPADYNGDQINTLHALAQCGHCENFFHKSDGYHHPKGGFYCDACVWLLADNGEFYCG